MDSYYIILQKASHSSTYCQNQRTYDTKNNINLFKAGESTIADVWTGVFLHPPLAAVNSISG